MSYISEPCGCTGGDSEYQSVINQSPILSGSQEAAFAPQNNDFSFLETSDSLFSDNNAVIVFTTSRNNEGGSHGYAIGLIDCFQRITCIQQCKYSVPCK